MVTATQEQTQASLEAAVATPIEFLHVPGDKATIHHHYGDLSNFLPAGNWMTRGRAALPDGRICLILTEVPLANLPPQILAAKNRDGMRTSFPVSEFPGCLQPVGT